MKLLRDDLNRVYVWVTDEENKIISPHFDYEEDADNWYFLIKDKINNEVPVVENIYNGHQKE